MRTRARAVRARAAVRRWNYRQRNLAAGVWFHIRRLLANAKSAYIILDDDAVQLLAEGYKSEPCGARLEPGKTLIFVDEKRLGQIESRRPIPVRLGPDFLFATAIALVPFD
jgi:hypothetical protein